MNKFHLKVLSFFLFFLTFCLSSVFAKQLEFSLFVKKQQQFAQTISSKDKKISVAQARAKVQQVRSATCQREESGNAIIITPVCFLKGVLPVFDFRSNVDLIRKNVKSFPRVYDLNASTFEYRAIQPKLDEEFVQLREKVHKDTTMLYYLALAQKAGLSLRVPKAFFAQALVPTYSFYAVKRSLAGRGDCSQRNFQVALAALDKRTIAPGQELNINKLVSNLPGYCKGDSTQDYLFYGGACGASTQLFRLSLIMPQLQVVQRFGHSERYARYYSDTVFGDDAAIYQMSKQLIIQNTSEEELYLRTRREWDDLYLIGISPQKSQTMVKVQKNQTTKLAWQVSKIVYKISGTVDDQQTRLTSYLRKNYQSN